MASNESLHLCLCHPPSFSSSITLNLFSRLSKVWFCVLCLWHRQSFLYKCLAGNHKQSEVFVTEWQTKPPQTSTPHYIDLTTKIKPSRNCWLSVMNITTYSVTKAFLILTHSYSRVMNVMTLGHVPSTFRFGRIGNPRTSVIDVFGFPCLCNMVVFELGSMVDMRNQD